MYFKTFFEFPNPEKTQQVQSSCQVWVCECVSVCLSSCDCMCVCVSIALMLNERCGEWEWLTHAQEPHWFAWSIMSEKKKQSLQRNPLSIGWQSAEAWEEYKNEIFESERKKGSKAKMRQERQGAREDRDRDRGSTDKTESRHSREKIMTEFLCERCRGQEEGDKQQGRSRQCEQWKCGGAFFYLIVYHFTPPLLSCNTSLTQNILLFLYITFPLSTLLSCPSPSHQVQHHDPANLKPLVALVISLLSITL